ncbi:MAG: glycosyltransferase family 2 protein [Deltaproteobacteria bacterium]|nr:glycosyltransferase family 2 protein [Deltaproteobacteria bacterium]
MATEVVIPIFNAFEESKACLASVLEHGCVRPLVVNDASTDPQIAPWLKSLGCRIRLLTNPRNLGFVQTVNRSLQHTAGDVCLLNSDTVVPSGWLVRLERALASSPTGGFPIGISTPLTNNGWFLSVPQANINNRLPGNVTVAQINERLMALPPRYPHIPTAIGFCMMISRKVIDRLGGFEVAFSPGYAEEVDYSFRARRAGFEIVCADDLFVYHRGASSFAQSETRLKNRGRNLLEVFWPGECDRIETLVDPIPDRRELLQSLLFTNDVISMSASP